MNLCNIIISRPAMNLILLSNQSKIQKFMNIVKVYLQILQKMENKILQKILRPAICKSGFYNNKKQQK